MLPAGVRVVSERGPDPVVERLALLAGIPAEKIRAGTTAEFTLATDREIWITGGRSGAAGKVDVEIRGLTEEEAMDLISLWRMCSVCGEMMPAEDRAARYAGRRAHAACALGEEQARVREQIHGDVTQPYPVAKS